MSYKKILTWFFVVNIILLFSVLTLLYIYDPLHVFHKSWITKDNRLHGNMRHQAAGIINNYDFDSIILGTSMMKGTSSLNASKKLGGKFVNISADGSSLIERKQILSYALKKRNLKSVIYSFDMGLDLNLKKKNRSFPLSNFNYLYDNNFINDFKVYWNSKYMKCLLSFSTNSKCFGNKRELVKPEKWFQSIFKRNQEISGLENWITHINGRGKNVYTRVTRHINNSFNTEDKYLKKLDESFEIIDTNLIQYIDKYPNTTFHIFMPPYSRFLYALWNVYNPKKYKLYKRTIQYLVDQSLQRKNMFVYSMDDSDYQSDINNYRDMRHYNTEMNIKMIDFISENKEIKSMKMFFSLYKKIDSMNKSYQLDNEVEKLLDAYKLRISFTKDLRDNLLYIKGWALGDRVDRVELRNGKVKIASCILKRNKDVSSQFPQYKQLNNSFEFEKIKNKFSDETLKLYFKSKSKIVKIVKVFEKGKK